MKTTMFWMLNYSEVCPQKWVFYQAVVVGIKDPFFVETLYISPKCISIIWNVKLILEIA